MDTWLSSSLSQFDLNSSDIIDYLLSIIEDIDEDIDDIIESCKDFLESSLTDDIDLSLFLNELKEKIISSRSGLINDNDKALQEFKEKQKQELIKSKKAEEELIKIQKQRENISNDKKLTNEERKERRKLQEMLLKYDNDMKLDKNGDFVYTGVDNDNDDLIICNTNIEHVKNQQELHRKQAKKKHEEKIKRDKEALEKDKLRKDKAKKRTQKREKRRGF